MQTEPRTRIARNRGRQRELYGCPLGDRVRRLTTALGITQARLARTIGLSPTMLSQLVSGHRVKIGDPAVLARLLLLDQRCAASAVPPPPDAVEALLAEVARARWQWAGPHPVSPCRHPAPGVEALRTVAAPARLAAAAVALGPAFPELAEVLRRAAAHDPGGARARPPGPGARRRSDRPW